MRPGGTFANRNPSISKHDFFFNRACTPTGRQGELRFWIYDLRFTNYLPVGRLAIYELGTSKNSSESSPSVFSKAWPSQNAVMFCHPVSRGSKIFSISSRGGAHYRSLAPALYLSPPFGGSGFRPRRPAGWRFTKRTFGGRFRKAEGRIPRDEVIVRRAGAREPACRQAEFRSLAGRRGGIW